MYLLYTDATGTPELSDTNTTHYATIGLAIPEGVWFSLERQIADLKARYAFPGIPLELHAKDICAHIREQDQIENFENLDRAQRRAKVLAIREAKYHGRHLTDAEKKKFRACNSVLHLSRRERSQLYEVIIDLVADLHDVRLFGEVVHKQHFYNIKNDIIHNSMSQIVSRFDAFLRRINRMEPENLHQGLMIMDHDPTYGKEMVKIFRDFRANGHPWGRVQHVVESPFFVDSGETSCIQAVDVCAYAVRRYIEHGTKKADSHEERIFAKIFPLFDKADNKLHGLRHYCMRGSCSCLICVTREHHITAD